MNTTPVMPNQKRSVSKTPGHWVLAQLGKKVLRPGGKELTNKMLTNLAITPTDSVVEFAPGMGYTAQLCLIKKPASYTAVEKDGTAADIVRSYLNGTTQTCVLGDAQSTGLSNDCATVVFGEAMLTMQNDAKKREIIAEAARILKAGGRYGIHELCLIPDTIATDKKREIQRQISDAIQHPAKPITPSEWKQLLLEQGLVVEFETTAPMHLLEPKRMIDDEGLLGFLTIAKNLILKPEARRRVFTMRKMFKQHSQHLAAVTFVASKKTAN